MRSSVSEILTEQTLGRGMRLPFGAYTGIEILDTLEVVAHERYEELLKKAGVLNEAFVDYRTRAALRINAKGQQVVRGLLMTDQSSGREAKAFLVFIYHLIPDTGFFHLPCILFRALLCVSSPLATISFRWLSSAFITSSAVVPWNGASQGPPICLHVIVFKCITSF